MAEWMGWSMGGWVKGWMEKLMDGWIGVGDWMDGGGFCWNTDNYLAFCIQIFLSFF
jgi:hypothetical protein